jgi:hypothetical protein
MITLVAVFDWGIRVTLSDILAVAGFLLAWQQHRRAVTAGKIVSETRHSMLKQRAMQHFDHLSHKAGILASAVRGKDWNQVAEVATTLGGLVSSASGFCNQLMLGDEKGNLDMAANGVKFILDETPLDEQPPQPETIRQMISQCTLIVYAVERIGGRMQYINEIDEHKEVEGKGRKRFWMLGEGKRGEQKSNGK